MDIFGNLNDKQRQAVLATEGYVRVIAGAGSGKTKLLVSRYAYLVTEYGIDPSNILCVTFTNKAAGEMKKRIQNLIGPEYSSSLICTYHGFCARLLREDPEKLFLSKGFQIIDSYQQRSILAEIYAKYELKLDFATFQKMLEKIGKYKYDLKYVPRMITAEPVQIMDSITDLNDQILEEYLQRQKALYCLDFEDLMNYALYLLKTDEGIREKWQSRLNYIMVDEFQDSDRTETELIEILSGQYKNLMIVGDPDQNIYEWRGSDVGLLVDFDKTHPETQTIILNQNYRSTPQILHLANTLIEKNELRLKKDLFTLSGSGSPVNHVHSRTEDDEVAYLVKVIKEQTSGLSAQRTFGDFAILYRSSFLSRVVERKLVQENIPYEIYGGVKFYQRMEIQDVVAYLRMIAWNDDVSFKRVVNTPKRKFGRVRVAALENIRNSNDVSLFEDDLTDKTLYEVLKGHLSDPAFNGSGGYEFVSLIERMKSLAPTVTLGELVNTVCAASGYEQYIRELGDEERLDNLSEFKRIANEFEQGYGENVSLETFLQQIALMSAEDDDKPKDAVRLMTIHASKGLEFPVVFLMGCTEGIFPSSKTIEQRKKMGLEEERRLAYVAITRARDQLYLMDSEGVSQKGMQKLPSRFLFEVGEENYVRIGHLTERLLDEATMYIRQLNIAMMDESDFLLGYGEGDGSDDERCDGERRDGEPPATVIAMKGPQMVEHHIFGRGEVISFDKKRKVFQIQFEEMDMPRSISAAYFLQNHEPQPEPPELPPEVGSGPVAQFSSGVGSGAADQPSLDGGSGPVAQFSSGVGSGAADQPSLDGGSGPVAQLSLNQSSPVNEGTDGELLVAEPNESLVAASDLPARDEDTTWYRKLPAWDADDTGEGGTTGADDTEMTPEDVSDLSAELREKLANSPNHWKDPSFPQTGWICTGIEDLGAPTAVCEMCGFQIIRYVHYMYHPQAGTLGCGCVCAGRLEGDLANARAREAALRSRTQRKLTFRKRTWKRSAKGSEYLTYKQHLIVLLHWRNPEQWRFAIDGTISDKAYESRLACIDAIFEYIENQA